MGAGPCLCRYPVAPLVLLAAAAGALLVAPYLPVFQLEDGPLVRALGTGTRGRVV